jgi:hypothetical protein
MPHRNDPDIQIEDFIRDRFAVWSQTRSQSDAFGYHSLIPMRPSAKDEWVTALESGDYDQVTGYLKVELLDLDPNVTLPHFGYCCWGVLCEIKRVDSDDHPPHPHTYTKGTVWDFKFEGLEEDADGTEIPPKYWTGRYGLQHPVVNTLAEANDNGYNFGEIAGWIRKYL